MNSSEVFERIDSVFSNIPCGTVSTFYTQTENKHHYILKGTIEAINNNPFSSISDAYNDLEPDSVTLDAGIRTFHIAFQFDMERIEGVPTTDDVSTLRVRPREAEKATISECSNCCRAVSRESHKITIRTPSETKFEAPESESHYLCTHCSIGHSDDVLGVIDWFGGERNNDGTLDIKCIKFISDDGPVDYTQCENPYVTDFVAEVLENGLV